MYTESTAFMKVRGPPVFKVKYKQEKANTLDTGHVSHQKKLNVVV